MVRPCRPITLATSGLGNGNLNRGGIRAVDDLEAHGVRIVDDAHHEVLHQIGDAIGEQLLSLEHVGELLRHALLLGALGLGGLGSLGLLGELLLGLLNGSLGLGALLGGLDERSHGIGHLGALAAPLIDLLDVEGRWSWGW